MTELITFGYPSGARGPRVAGTPDRRVRRPACGKGFLARDVQRID